MTPTLTPVQPVDAGTTEGPADPTHPSMKLYFALQEVAQTEADSLYQQVLAKQHLGFVNPEQWAAAMNAAIAIWNQRQPSSVQAIKAAYGLAL